MHFSRSFEVISFPPLFSPSHFSFFSSPFPPLPTVLVFGLASPQPPGVLRQCVQRQRRRQQQLRYRTARPVGDRPRAGARAQAVPPPLPFFHRWVHSQFPGGQTNTAVRGFGKSCLIPFLPMSSYPFCIRGHPRHPSFPPAGVRLTRPPPPSAPPPPCPGPTASPRLFPCSPRLPPAVHDPPRPRVGGPSPPAPPHPSPVEAHMWGSHRLNLFGRPLARAGLLPFIPSGF